MKLFKTLKNIVYELIYRRHIVPHKYSLTIKGRCILYYLLDYHINSSRTDYIEAYEEQIRAKVNNWRESGILSVWFLPQFPAAELSDIELHDLAVLSIYTTLLSTISPHERKPFYDAIENSTIRDIVIQAVECGHLRKGV